MALRSSASWSAIDDQHTYLPPSSVRPKKGGRGGAVKKCQDERPPWSDSLSAARALVMWKGRVLIGVRRSGEALERRAVLVRKDIVENGGDTIV